MPIIIENRRIAQAALFDKHAKPILIDTTSKGSLPYRKLSPFYPHGNIPIPFSPSYFATSVEGIWQGLKVFAHAGIDPSKFEIINMRGIKRANKDYGQILGHQKGIDNGEILGYVEAKKKIYIPSYLWVIKNFLQQEMRFLAEMSLHSTVVLIDYNTANNPLDPARPISHASLCKLYLEGYDLENIFI